MHVKFDMTRIVIQDCVRFDDASFDPLVQKLNEEGCVGHERYLTQSCQFSLKIYFNTLVQLSKKKS